MATRGGGKAAEKKKDEKDEKVTAQVSLRGRFRPGTRVRLVKASRPEALRVSEGDELLAVKKVGEDCLVRFTDADGVEVGGRYFIVGFINGSPADVRVRGREPGDESGTGLQPVTVDAVRHGDGSLVGERGQIKAGDPVDKPAVPFHPEPGEEG